MKTYDVIVIGAGPGGYVAAEEAGRRGKTVLLVEERELGGVCLNSGCIPTKTLLHTGKQFLHLRNSDVRGIAPVTPELRWEEALAWKEKVLSTYRKGIETLLKGAKVELLNGRARFKDRSSIEVDGTTYSAGAFIIATGSRPAMPPIPGLADSPSVVTSTELLERKTIPQRLAVIGGGVIGLEFGALYSQLGSRVDVVEMLPDIVPFMEAEHRKGLMRALKPIEFHLGCLVEAVEKDPDGGCVVVFRQSGTAAPGLGGAEQPSAASPSQPPAVELERIKADLILVAAGRKANIEDLGLEAAGVKTSKGYILVNERMETSAPRVYAIGDVVGTSLFAHSASRMAEVAVQVLCGDRSAAMDYRAIPWAVYTWPEAAGCGLTEAAAIQAGRSVVAAQALLRLSARFYAEQENQSGMVKVVADAADGTILGVHILGAACSEMIWGASMMVQLGITVDDAVKTIFPHPTVGEVMRDALLSLREKLRGHASGR